MNIYPYFIFVQNPAAEEAQQNNEGDFVTSVEGSWNFYQNGRDEINSSGKKIAMTNGENIEYHAIIYAKNGENLNYGTSIIVAKTKLDTSLLSDENFISESLKSGEIRFKGSVKGFSKSRLNVRIWV